MNLKKQKSNDLDKEKINQAIAGLTPDEQKRLHTLPHRVVRFGSMAHSCLYDKENLLLYILDEKGIPTGEKKALSRSLDEIKEDAVKNNPDAEDVEKKSGKRNLFKKEPADGEAPDKRKILVLIALIAIVLFLTIVAVGIITNLPREPKNDVPSAENQRAVVIKLNQSVLPGTLLDKSMFEQESITNEKLNELALTGTSVYTWDYIDTLSEMYSTVYIPKETQYLTTGNVSGSQIVYANPFYHLTSDDNAFLEIPANIPYSNLSDIIIGRHVDLTIEKKTISSVPQRLETKDVEGLDHSSSITERTTTDIFRLRDVVIRDVLNAEGISLYEVLSRYNAVPDGVLEDYLNETLIPTYEVSKGVDITNINEIFPEFHATKVIIELPKDQVKAIGKLTSELTSLKVSNLTDNYEAETASEIEFVAEAKFTTSVLSAVIKKLDK